MLLWLGYWYIQFSQVALNQPFFGAIFVSLLRELGQWSLAFAEGFWTATLFQFVYLAIHAVIGVLFLRLFFQLPKILELSLAPFLGIGLVHFAMQFLAIFMALNRASISMVLALFLIALTLAQRFIGRSQCRPSFEAEALQSSGERWLFYAAWALLGLISLFGFYYSVLYPVDYWDSLILYVHYSKLTYLHCGFPPIEPCLQVGLGLGANYPHLYSLQQAATATLFGSWSDLYAQWTAPLAGVASIAVMYYLFLHLFKQRLTAVLAVLAFRALPFVSSYYVYASDYALVMLFTCIFLLFAALFFDAPSARRAQPFLLTAAIFPQINYLGVIVWPCVALAFLWALYAQKSQARFSTLLGSSCLWFAVAMIWYVRNYLVTGNPVYAFFPEIFGGMNINLEVLASANQEWLAHGNGFAQLGDTLYERVVGSIRVFLLDWRIAPLTGGLLIPAMCFGWRRARGFDFVVLLLVFLYALYQYVISGLYLYHTIALFPLLSVYAARFLADMTPRWRTAYAVLIILAGLAPGLSASIMGTKIGNPTLPIFAAPGMSPQAYYAYRYPEISPVWRYINENLEPLSLVLTHDNRHHVYRDDIGRIHLDDCGLTPFYGRPYDEVHQELLRRDVNYYLRIPDEATHPITAQLGHLNYLGNPAYFELVRQHQRVELYRIKRP